MPRVYLDNTFYNFVEKGWFAPGEVDDFRALNRSGRILTYFSPINADELLGDWHANRASAVRRFQIAEDLVGFRNLLKQPADILRDEIKAYAEGRPSPPMTMTPTDRATHEAQLHAVAQGTHRADVLEQIAFDVGTMKNGYAEGMTEARRLVLEHMRWAERSSAERKALRWEGFYEEGAEYWAQIFADRAAVGPECQTRGIQGLLRRRPVQLAVGACMSLMFSLSVPLSGGHQTREADSGDGFDVWHALSAAAADIFLTCDRKLAGNVGRLQIDHFRLVTSLRELLDEPALSRFH